MKVYFDESKHPRDEQGRFTEKQQEAAKVYDSRFASGVRGGNKTTLTKQEFAQWYDKLGEIKRGGFVDKRKNGDTYIKIGNKIAVTGGSYEKPILRRVFEFHNEEELFKKLQELKEL